jgi:hypothetical protein
MTKPGTSLPSNVLAAEGRRAAAAANQKMAMARLREPAGPGPGQEQQAKSQPRRPLDTNGRSGRRVPSHQTEHSRQRLQGRCEGHEDYGDLTLVGYWHPAQVERRQDSRRHHQAHKAHKAQR